MTRMDADYYGTKDNEGSEEERHTLNRRKDAKIFNRRALRAQPPYGVRSKAMWLDGKTIKGYAKSDFAEIWPRYVSRGDFEWRGSFAESPPLDYALDVLDLLNANASRTELLPLWRAEVSKVSGGSRNRWLTYGLHLGCFPNIASEELLRLLSDQALDSERNDILLRGRRADVIEADPTHLTTTLDNLLDRRVTSVSNQRQQRLIDAFGQALDVTRYAIAFRDNDQEALREKWKKRGGRGFADLRVEFEQLPEHPAVSQCKEVIQLATALSGREARRWATELASWDELVSLVVQRFGQRWAAVTIANVASGIKSSSETCTDCSEVFDSSRPLCRRARYARLRAGNPGWWTKTWQQAATLDEKMLASVLWFTWTSPNTILQTISLADRVLKDLPDDAWQLLFDSVESAIELARSEDRSLNFENEMLPPAISVRAAVLLRLRMRWDTAGRVVHEKLRDYDGTDTRILKICQKDAVERMYHGSDWAPMLPILARAYANGVVSVRYSTISFLRQAPMYNLQDEVALRICERAGEFPSFLVAAAELKVRDMTAKKVRPVAKAAKEERWFE